jgi:hypothetical protein
MRGDDAPFSASYPPRPAKPRLEPDFLDGQVFSECEIDHFVMAITSAEATVR